MIGALKWQIRSWQQAGRHEWLTRAATFSWLQLYNVRDFLTIGRVGDSLRDGSFPDDVNAAVDEVCEGRLGAGIRPMQAPFELASLMREVSDRRPKTVLEIGTARGGTLFLLCRFSAPDAKIISVDLPYGRNGGGYPKWKESHYRRFCGEQQELNLLRADSHSKETVDKVDRIVGGDGIDFIMIDADHSYEGVKQDYMYYLPLLAPGGVIALHDVLPTDDPSIDVNRFWVELENDTSVQTKTIVADPEQGRYGIGLVYPVA
ncbi:class I SAM-dependent methyltransferase [Halovulum marinum]|nr:class I SAM-dependent methyltransferase [Halovulum marinum]